MTRLDATALAVLLGLSKSPGWSVLGAPMRDDPVSGLVETILKEASGLSGSGRAGFLLNLAGEVVREETRWLNP